MEAPDRIEFLKVTRERDQLRQMCADQLLVKQLADQLERDLESSREDLLKVVRGEFGQICSYCGEGNENGLSWEDLQAHIRSCEKHPLKIALDGLDKLARLGNEPHLGNSDGNRIAQDIIRRISL